MLYLSNIFFKRNFTTTNRFKYLLNMFNKPNSMFIAEKYETVEECLDKIAGEVRMELYVVDNNKERIEKLRKKYKFNKNEWNDYVLSRF